MPRQPPFRPIRAGSSSSASTATPLPTTPSSSPANRVSRTCTTSSATRAPTRSARPSPWSAGTPPAPPPRTQPATGPRPCSPTARRSTLAPRRLLPGVDPADVEPYPVGLRMISGDSMSTEPQFTEGVGFSCSRQQVRSTTPRECAPGAPMTLRVVFPDCWDTRNLDSEDHKSHMAFSDNDGCPSSHPQPLPQLEFVISYDFDGDLDDLRLASGPPRPPTPTSSTPGTPTSWPRRCSTASTVTSTAPPPSPT